MSLSPYIFNQYLDDNGDPISNGKVYFWASGGSYSTPKDTYTTEDLSTANANPLILDAGGRATAFLSGDYDVQLKTSADVLIKTVDDVTSGNSYGSIFLTGRAVGGGGGATAGAAEEIDVSGVSRVFITPAGGGHRYYDFTNKTDGQPFFIKNNGSNNCSIDDDSATTPVYLLSTTTDVVCQWDSTSNGYVGTKGGDLSV